MGFPMNNVELIDTENLDTIQVFKGHCERVLYMAINNQGDMAATGSPDQTIRFWNIKNLYHNSDKFKEEISPNLRIRKDWWM